jgi:hypothetical protein
MLFFFTPTPFAAPNAHQPSTKIEPPHFEPVMHDASNKSNVNETKRGKKQNKEEAGRRGSRL